MHLSSSVRSEVVVGCRVAAGELSPDRGVIYAVDVGAPVREALSELEESLEMEIVSFGKIQEFLDYSRTDECSCLILNLYCQGQEDFRLQCKLAVDAFPPVIFTCQHGDVPSVIQALKSNPSELLAPPITSADLGKAILAAFSEDRSQRRQKAERRSLEQRHSLLTPREKETLPFVVGGLLNKQAASMLGISEVTFQIHRSQMMRKMRAQSVADLVRMAVSLQIPYWIDSGSATDLQVRADEIARNLHRSPLDHGTSATVRRGVGKGSAAWDSAVTEVSCR